MALRTEGACLFKFVWGPGEGLAYGLAVLAMWDAC